jgi:hypothetical protein
MNQEDGELQDGSKNRSPDERCAFLSLVPTWRQVTSGWGEDTTLAVADNAVLRTP